MGSLKGSTTQKTSQSSEPPAWAKPLLEKVAGEAMNMFNTGQGYNVYRGPTQANFSPQKLQALNKMMTMTGGGPAVTNEGIFNNAQIQQARGLINQQMADEQKRKAAAAAAAAAVQQQAAMKKFTPGRYGGMTDLRGGGVGGRGGERGSGSGVGAGGGGSGWGGKAGF